jgi:hypothetical protein
MLASPYGLKHLKASSNVMVKTTVLNVCLSNHASASYAHFSCSTSDILGEGKRICDLAAAVT